MEVVHRVHLYAGEPPPFAAQFVDAVVHHLDDERRLAAQAGGADVAPRDDALGKRAALGPLAAAGDDEVGRSGGVGREHRVAEGVEHRFGGRRRQRADVAACHRVQTLQRQAPGPEHLDVAVVELVKALEGERHRRTQFGRAQCGQRPRVGGQVIGDRLEAARHRQRAQKAHAADREAGIGDDALGIREPSFQEGVSAGFERMQSRHDRVWLRPPGQVTLEQWLD